MNRIFVLTKIGEGFAANPTSAPSTGRKILYFIRRHGGQATDDQVYEFIDADRGEIQTALNKLLRMKAIAVVGR